MTSPKSSKPSPAGGELSGLLRRAEALQKELDKAQVELKDEEVEGSDAAGRIRFRWNGEGVPLSVVLNLPGLSEADTRALEQAC